MPVDFDLASGFTITASGVTIQDLTIRHAFDGVRIREGSDDVTVDGVSFIRDRFAVRACDFEDPPNDNNCEGVPLDPPENVTVATSRAEGSIFEPMIEIQGDGAVVVYNVLLNAEGIGIIGSGFVSHNAMAITTDDSCIEVGQFSGDSSDDGLIEQNVLTVCGDAAVIDVTNANDVVIRHNTILAGDDNGIGYREGEGARIEGNWIRGQPDEESGIWVSEGPDANRSRDMEILYNIIRDFSEDGIEFRGIESLIQGNIVERTANDPGEANIRLSQDADDNEVLDNIVRFSTNAGIKNEDGGVDETDRADRNVYRGNFAVQNLASGILIEGGEDNVVDANLTEDNAGEGINIGLDAVDTDVTDNTSTGNRTDICNDGTGTTDSGNTFTTGGFTTACVVQQTFP